MPAHRKDFAEAVAMYNSGLSIGDVANRHSMTRQAMYKILKRRGVSFRPKLRYCKQNHFYRDGGPSDERVHAITTIAIQNGVLQRKPCEVCGYEGKRSDGRSSVEAHHDDYNYPLRVRWLCFNCHREWHQHNKPIRRTIDLPLTPKRQVSSMGGKASWRNRQSAQEQLAQARERRWTDASASF